MNHLTRSLFPLAAFALTIAPLTAADTVEIKPSLPIGKKILRTMKMEQTGTIEAAGQKFDQKSTSIYESTTGITKHEDGKQKRMSVKYDRVAFDVVVGPQKIAYDSAKPDTDTLGLGKAVSAIVGKDLKISLNANEEVTGIENYDTVAAGLGGAAGSPLGQMFGKDQMMDMLKQGTLLALPGKPVKTGDSWPVDVTIRVAAVGALNVKGTYTLKSVGPHNGVPCLEIGVDAKLDTTPASTAKVSGGKAIGTLWFDPALGIVRDSDSTETMEITMKNPLLPDVVMTIPTTQRITQTVTKVEDLK